MKTTINIILIALVSLAVGSCSSSMQMSKSSGSQGDGIYYTPSEKSASSDVAADVELPKKPISTKELELAELEKKYEYILTKNENIDTLVYESESSNPYDRILSTTYADSYARRLRARSGLTTSFVYYSDDYRYALSYDPYFYNIIVMGDEVWVEPHYITAMFGWPYSGSNFAFGYSLGVNFWTGYNPYAWYSWGYNPWGWNYWNSWGYPGYWGHSYSWYNGYAWGYNNGYWDGYHWGNNYNTSGGYYNYGPRPGTGYAVETVGIRPGGNYNGINDRIRDIGETQPVLTNDAVRQRDPRDNGQEVIATRPNAASFTRDNNQGQEVVTTRPNRANVTNNNELIVTRPNRVNVEGNRDNNSTREPMVVTRPSRANDNPTRVNPNDPTSGSSNNAREPYMPNYTRPKPASSNEFNRPTRNYTPSDAGQKQPTAAPSSNENRQPAARPSGNSNQQPSRTYSPPPRNEKPASTPSNSSGSSNDRPARVSQPSPSSSSPAPSSRPASSGSEPSRSSGSSSGNSRVR
jgi:hypothetical protein